MATLPPKITIDRGLQTFTPTTFNLDDTFDYFSATAGEPTKCSDSSDMVLRKSELKSVQRTFVQHAVDCRSHQADPLEPFAWIGCSNGNKARQFLTHTSSQSKGTNDKQLQAWSSLKCTAVVIIWDGDRYPPPGIQEDEVFTLSIGEGNAMSPCEWDLPWDQTWQGKSTGHCFRQHKILLYPEDDRWTTGNWLSILHEQHAKALDNSDQHVSANIHLFAVPVHFESEKATLKELLVQRQSDYNGVTCPKVAEKIQTIMKHDFMADKPDTKAVHANKFYDFGQIFTKGIQGFEFVAGTDRRLAVNAYDNVMLRTGLSTKLFLPTTSVAQFMVEYCGSADNAAKYDFHETLSKVLKGKLVTFRLSVGRDTRAIYMLSRNAPSTVPTDDRERTWGSKPERRLEYPLLPCLNIGLPAKQVLIPPELCVFLPMQSCRAKPTANMSRQIAMARQEMVNMDLLPADANVQLGTSVYSVKTEKLAHDVLNDQLEKAFTKIDASTKKSTSGVNILFVDVGDQKLDRATFTAIRKSMYHNKILAEVGMSPTERDPLYLQFKPNSRFLTERWATQLRRFIKANEDASKVTALVFCMQKSPQHKALYKMIKYICDCAVGVQSFFCNVDAAMAKKEKNKLDKFSKVTNEIVSRMRIRNPPPLPDPSKSGSKDIAVAYHVAQVQLDVPELAVDGKIVSKSVTRYLVVFFTRHATESRYYASKVILKSPQEISKYNPTKDLIEILSKLLPTKKKCKDISRVTVMRSGIMLPLQTLADAIEEEGLNEAILADMESGSVSKKKLAEVECALFTKRIQANFHHETPVSFVLVSADDDFVLSGHVQEAVSTMANEAAGKDYGQLFLVDTRLQPDAQTVSAHSKLNTTGDTKFVNLTILETQRAKKVDKLSNLSLQDLTEDDTDHLETSPTHDDLSSSGRQSSLSSHDSVDGSVYIHEQNSVQSGIHIPKVRGASSQPSPNLKAKDSKLSISTSTVRPEEKRITTQRKITRTQTYAQVEEPKTNVTKAQLEHLAAMWRDQRLGLHDTKLPVPTHIAHLIVKRALMHMQFDQFDESGNGDACVLPPVHENVANTLYFL